MAFTPPPPIPDESDYARLRAGFANELDDPAVEQQIYNLTANEVGGQGPAAHQAFIETIFNRAQSRGQSLYQTATDRKYYPSVSFRPRPGANYQDSLLAALQGSDISGGATGNASGTVGFAGGPQTFAAGGERFGIEGPDLRRRSSGFTPPPPIPDAQQEMGGGPRPPVLDSTGQPYQNIDLTRPTTGQTAGAPSSPVAAAEPSTLDQLMAFLKKPSPEILQGPEAAVRDFIKKPSPEWLQPAEKFLTAPLPGAKEAIHLGYQYGSPLGWIEDIAPESAVGKKAGEIRQKLEQVGAGFTSPANIGLIATGAALPKALPAVGAAINRLIGAGFTAQQAKDTYETYQKYEAATDPEEKARLKQDLIISGGLTAMLGAGTLAPHAPTEVKPEVPEGGVPPPVEPAVLTQALLRRNELLSKDPTSPELDVVEAKIKELGGDVGATQKGVVKEGSQPEYLGVPQGANIPANREQVRESEGGQAGDSGSVVGEAPVEAPVEPAQPEAGGQKTFSTKNAVGAAADAARREDSTAWAEAEAIHNDNPAAPRLLVDELAKNPRPVKDFENHLVLRRQIELANEHEAAVKRMNENPGDPAAEAQLNAILDEQNKVTEVNKFVGREAGLGFRSRQILADQDYNLLKMQATTRAVVNRGKALSREQLADVQKLHDRIKAAEDKVAEYEARDQFRQMVEARRANPSPLPRETAGAGPTRQRRGPLVQLGPDYRGTPAEIAAAKLRAEAGEPIPAGRGKLMQRTAFLEDAYKRAKERIVERRGRLQAGIDPTSLLDEAVVGAYHIERGLTKFADWSQQMLTDLGERIRPYLHDLWKRAQQYHADATKGLGRVRGGTQRTPETILRGDKTRIARDIAKYQEKVRTGDVTPLRQRRAPLMDKEKAGLLFEREEAKGAYHEMLVKAKLKQQLPVQKVFRYAGEALRTARSIKTSFDVSAMFRQGGFNYFAHPIAATRAIRSMALAIRSKAGQFRAMQEIRDRPNYPEYKQSGLFLSEESGASLTKAEEVYASRVAGKIPGVGASERAYITYLNRIRADRYDAMKSSLGRFKGWTGKGTEVTPGEAKAIANFVNETTGRGYLPARMQGAAEALNAAFFAPRYVISRFQTLLGHPLWYGLGSASPHVRAMIAFEYARTLTGIGLFMAAATQAGARIETDRRSSDFMKLRFGNLRIDPLAGIQQVGVLLSRLQTGEKKTSSGKVLPLRGEVKFGQASAWDVISRFLWSKLGPAPGAAVNIAAGQDPTGKPTTAVNEALKFALPLGPQDIASTMQAQGVPRKLALSLVAAGGMGVSNYASTSAEQHAAYRKRLERRDRALLHGDIKEAYRLSQ